ncbi:MAG: amino acid adenylation domain-containing protein [Burkholderiaceae bacterium]
MEGVETAKSCGNFEVFLNVADTGRSASLACEYNPDLFDSASIKSWLGYYRELLSGVATHPATCVAELPMLGERDRARVLSDWNGTTRPYPTHVAVHSLLRQQARRTPQAVALRSRATALTYAELQARTQRLARHLRSLGIARGALVGLCVQRSVDMVVAQLAILECGAAYVPLDPSYPGERLAYMAQDAALALLVTESSLAGALDWPRAKSVWLDLDAQAIAAQPAGDLEPSLTLDARPEDPAYVIYTSGSTGKPKGVVVPHRAVVNFLTSMAREPGLSESDRLVAVTTLSFDIAVLELLLPLSVGAELVLAGRVDVLDGHALRSLLATSQASVMHATPSTWRMLIDAGWQGTPSFKALVGGEALPPDLAQQLLGRCAELWNMYGPTETTVWSTCWKVEQPEAGIRIGRPIANTQVHVLDERGQLCPIGVPGEICIAGAGVALGYLNRAELSAERFVADPFSAEPQARLYRSGDRGRWRHDGLLEHLGRLDFQVKVRGHRIELGEIESNLMQHPQVRRALVLVREDQPGDVRLVAYVVAKEAMPVASALREHLRVHLPESMLPQHFVPLEAIPLLPNGKIDRKALPVPAGAIVLGAAVAPRDPVEQGVWEIWRDVLKLERFGVHDNFFDLGGHSLLAMQVISRLRVTLNVELPLVTLFDSPTVAGLARQSVSSLAEKSGGLDPIVLRNHADPVPLSSVQLSIWLADHLNDRGTAYNMQSAQRLKGPLDLAALESSLQALVEHHDSLRLSVIERAGTPMQVAQNNVKLELRRLDLSSIPQREQLEELHKILRTHAALPFDLARAPLARAYLVVMGEDDHVLQLVVHHIVSDGWSAGILRRDLADLYSAFSEGRAAPRPASGPGFLDYAHWEQSRVARGLIEPHTRYWIAKLRGIEPLNLPVDTSRARETQAADASVEAALPRNAVIALNRVAKRANATMFMVYLAAFKLLLMRWCGQEDVAVGTPISRRELPELAQMVGPLLNTVVLRTDLSGNPSFTELIARVRATTLDSFSHQEQPFDTLVAELNPARIGGRNPLFDVLVNSMEEVVGIEPLKGLEIERVDVRTEAAKFALTLYIMGQADSSTFALNYRTDLFDREQICTLLDQYVHLLAQIAVRDDLLIRSYSLVTDAARALLPDPTQKLGAAVPALIFEDFLEQANRFADRIAVSSEAGVLTYADLESISRGVAQWLIDSGVCSGDRVVIYANRNISLIAAVLGAARAGAIFSILDSFYPEARNFDCIGQVSPKVILDCSEKSKPIAFSGVLSRSIPRTPAQMLIEFSSQRTSLPIVDSSATAYISFTSGTSGRQKGILTNHAPLPHFVRWHAKQHALGPNDRFSMLSGISHDPLLRDIFVPLSIGATLCIPRQSQLLEPALLVSWLRECEISVAHLTPTLGHIISTGAGISVHLQALRNIFWGGEVLTTATISRFTGIAPNASHFNFYGATETPQAMGYYAVQPQADGHQFPIGRGIPQTQLLLLTDAGTIAAPEHTGEIVVRTPYLSNGYLRDSELTRAKFIQNPYSEDPADICYRTGDLGRFRSDGNIVYIGRIDDQIKIRGFRVEPAEIVKIAKEVGGVDVAVARAFDDKVGGTTIGLFYSCAGSIDIPEEVVLSRVRQSLPSHMWPRFVTRLASFPVSPNGKIDLKSLQAPTGLISRAKGAPPRNAVERAIWDIWTELLPVQHFGVHDNFFDLGGHSLLAARLMARIGERFTKKLPLTAALAAPTIGQLAALLDEPCASDSLVLIRPGGSGAPIFFVHDGNGETLLYRNLALALHAEHAVYGLQPRSAQGHPMLHTRIPEMAAYQVSKIRSVQPHGPYLLGGLCAGGVIAFEIARQLQTQGETVAMLALIDAAAAQASAPSARLAARRLKSFASVYNNDGSMPIPRFLLAAAGRAGLKAKNFLAFQAQDFFRSTRDAKKFRLLRESLDKGAAPPKEAEGLTSQQIYFYARRDYEVPRPLHGDVLLFRATSGGGMTADAPLIDMHADATFGWQRRVSGRVHVFDIPGGHSSMLQEPNVKVLAAQLQSCIDAALVKARTNAQRVAGGLPAATLGDEGERHRSVDATT